MVAFRFEAVIKAPLGLPQWFNGFGATRFSPDSFLVAQKPLNPRRKVRGDLVTGSEQRTTTRLATKETLKRFTSNMRRTRMNAVTTNLMAGASQSAIPRPTRCRRGIDR